MGECLLTKMRLGLRFVSVLGHAKGVKVDLYNLVILLVWACIARSHSHYFHLHCSNNSHVVEKN